MSRYWFRRKKFGWGLEPGSIEGWVATILFFVVCVGGVFELVRVKAAPSISLGWTFAWIAVYIAVVIAKGEKFW